MFADSIAKKYYDWNIEKILLYLLIEYYLKIDKQYNEFGIQGFKKKQLRYNNMSKFSKIYQLNTSWSYHEVIIKALADNWVFLSNKN